ncbi:transposase [Streptomyces sp. NPDC059122]|uniref:transposase n=1 Tax=Streptomyces sp. NPDC059122 TaxID=3346732 RepID=UPI003684D392
MFFAGLPCVWGGLFVFPPPGGGAPARAPPPLSWRAVRVVRPEVRVVDDTGFPKDGTSSPGVARQHSGTLEGPSLNNCQS